METVNRFPDGVLVKCPGCLAEVSANEAPSDLDAPFRCMGCTMRGNDAARRFAEKQQREKVPYGEGKSDNNDSAKPSKARSRAGGDSTAQQ